MSSASGPAARAASLGWLAWVLLGAAWFATVPLRPRTATAAEIGLFHPIPTPAFGDGCTAMFFGGMVIPWKIAAVSFALAVTDGVSSPPAFFQADTPAIPPTLLIG